MVRHDTAKSPISSTLRAQRDVFGKVPFNEGDLTPKLMLPRVRFGASLLPRRINRPAIDDTLHAEIKRGISRVRTEQDARMAEDRARTWLPIRINHDHPRYRYVVKRGESISGIYVIPTDSGEMYLYQPVSLRGMIGQVLDDDYKLWKYITLLPAISSPNSICKIRHLKSGQYYKTRTFVCADDVYELVDGAYVALNCGFRTPKWLQERDGNLLVFEGAESGLPYEGGLPVQFTDYVAKTYDLGTGAWSLYGGQVTRRGLSSGIQHGEWLYVSEGTSVGARIWRCNGGAWELVWTGGKRERPSCLVSDGTTVYAAVEKYPIENGYLWVQDHVTGAWILFDGLYAFAWIWLVNPHTGADVIQLTAVTSWERQYPGIEHIGYDTVSSRYYTYAYTNRGTKQLFSFGINKSGAWGRDTIITLTSDPVSPLGFASGLWDVSYLSLRSSLYRINNKHSVTKIAQAAENINWLSVFDEQILASTGEPMIYHSEWEHDRENGWAENKEYATTVKGAYQGK